MPAVTPSALAHVTLWVERVMSPAAYTPCTVVILSLSVLMMLLKVPSSNSQPSCCAISLFSECEGQGRAHLCPTFARRPVRSRITGHTHLHLLHATPSPASTQCRYLASVAGQEAHHRAR